MDSNSYFSRNCVGGNPAIFHFLTSSTSIGFQFEKGIPVLNTVPPLQLGLPQISSKIVDSEQFGAHENCCQLHSGYDRDSDSGSELSIVASKYWIAMIRLHGSEEAKFCEQQRISVNLRSNDWLSWIHGSASGTNFFKLALSQITPNWHIPTI